MIGQVNYLPGILNQGIKMILVSFLCPLQPFWNSVIHLIFYYFEAHI
jgi:hypothetical protein